jgi:hypothetical protein
VVLQIPHTFRSWSPDAEQADAEDYLGSATWVEYLELLVVS